MDTWNKRVSARREEMGLSKAEFARRCKVSPPTVNDWENGDIKELSGPKLLAVCEALEVDPWFVVTGTSRFEPPKREANSLLSEVAQLLIQCVLRLDGLGEIGKKTLTAHLTLLSIAEQALGMQDAEVVRELHVQKQKLADHVDLARGPHANHHQRKRSS